MTFRKNVETNLVKTSTSRPLFQDVLQANGTNIQWLVGGFKHGFYFP